MESGLVFAGVMLFVFFLIMDAILNAFRSALMNVNENDIARQAEEGIQKAQKVKKITDNPSRFLDTFDLAVYVSNFIAGGFVLHIIKKEIERRSSLNPQWITFFVGIGLLAILLIFGVLIPKNGGKRKPEKTALSLVGICSALINVLMPFYWLINKISRLFLRMFGINPDAISENVTEEEIITMVNEGQEQGVLEASEAEMIANIFELNDKTAGEIMTHRTAIVALDCGMTLESVIQKHIEGSFSRFPVYEGDIDNIIGTLHIRDALIAYRALGERKKKISQIKRLIRPALFVPDSRNIDDLLRVMQAKKIHMSIVVDEYGQTAGIVTMEDIIEEIVGNIMDEYDKEETGYTQKGEDSYVVDGFTQLEDLNELLGTNIASDEYETINGYLISKLNRIPEENEKPQISEEGYTFKIMEVSGNVIRKIEITKETEEENCDIIKNSDVQNEAKQRKDT